MIKNKAEPEKPLHPDLHTNESECRGINIIIERRLMARMLLPPCFVKKLQRITCDRRDLDRRFLHLSKCFKEAEKALNCKKKN